jgi:hypothetical protein
VHWPNKRVLETKFSTATTSTNSLAVNIHLEASLAVPAADSVASGIIDGKGVVIIRGDTVPGSVRLIVLQYIFVGNDYRAIRPGQSQRRFRCLFISLELDLDKDLAIATMITRRSRSCDSSDATYTIDLAENFVLGRLGKTAFVVS